MKRSKYIYLACICVLGLVIFIGLFNIKDMFYEKSAGLQDSRDVTQSDIDKETPQMSQASLSLNERLQRGDVENGRKVFRHCVGCHASRPDQFRRVGPTLWEIVNRPIASVEDFVYSRALRANSDKIWDFSTLDDYLRSPREAIPGTIMTFRGIKHDQDRADLLLYLRGLSDNPVALPFDNESGEQE
ncbi:c-type cytochrome [Bartonella sp. F02]|uniref:c-type cytochrome n=1 Tax=Bartonella sp. F02 TaxID=2967262 RepID=UPI0022A919B9|nr:cytochrome c family protein [Bartonella sp. F02]MCZ2328074.1 cytochrome c family protein [Bartonella sp. F02]